MEISSGLLVALMFISILSLGIVGIISGLAAGVNRRSAFRLDKLHTSWMLLVLFSHLNLFWHVIDILNVDAWSFVGFLFMILGPVLLFFATSVLLPDGTDADPGDVWGHYLECAPQFFVLLALVQGWLVVADFVLGNGLTSATVWTIAYGVMLLILALVRSTRVHQVLTGLVWLLMISFMSFRASGS